MVNLSNAREIDLHGLRLYDAEVMICSRIEEAWYAGEEALLLIHGYNNGVAIKNFIRKQTNLRNKLLRDYPDIPEVEIILRDHGSTYVVFSEE